MVNSTKITKWKFCLIKNYDKPKTCFNVVSFITNNFYFMKSQQLAQQGSTYILTKPASQCNGALD